MHVENEDIDEREKKLKQNLDRVKYLPAEVQQRERKNAAWKRTSFLQQLGGSSLFFQRRKKDSSSSASRLKKTYFTLKVS